jgi:hypothetical protein
VIEKFLDDDADMHNMNLTAKELREAEERRALEHEQNVRGRTFARMRVHLPAADLHHDPCRDAATPDMLARADARRGTRSAAGPPFPLPRPQADKHSIASTGGSRSSGSSSSASSDSSVEEAETAVVEMLLETYFMHIDNTLNKLQV